MLKNVSAIWWNIDPELGKLNLKFKYANSKLNKVACKLYLNTEKQICILQSKKCIIQNYKYNLFFSCVQRCKTCTNPAFVSLILQNMSAEFLSSNNKSHPE